jgi:tripartite-type tricarboxylate transporter receptor subunit TctC
MAKRRPPYTPEFRHQMVELVRAGRSPEELAQEFQAKTVSVAPQIAAGTIKAYAISSSERLPTIQSHVSGRE